MPYASEQIIIPLSRKKLAFMIVGATGFVAVGVWLYMQAGEPHNGNPLFMQVVGVVCSIFFGACALYGVIKLFDSSPGLVIDAEGIIDNASGVSAGRIPWADITSIDLRAVQKQRLLTVNVLDPDKYIQQAAPLKRALVALNARYFGSPIQIASNALQINTDELLKVLKESHAKYTRA